MFFVQGEYEAGEKGFDQNALEQAFNLHNARPYFSLFDLRWLAKPAVRVAAAAPVAVAEGRIASVHIWRAWLGLTRPEATRPGGVVRSIGP